MGAIMAGQGMSYSVKMFIENYKQKDGEGVKKALEEHYPHYDVCDTTLSTQYDTAFKEEVENNGGNTSYHCYKAPKVCVVNDPKWIPPEVMCVKPVIKKEKPFIRPTGKCEPVTSEKVFCDTRIPTLATEHYAFKEKIEEANEFFGKPQEVEGVVDKSNYATRPQVVDRGDPEGLWESILPEDLVEGETVRGAEGSPAVKPKVGKKPKGKDEGDVTVTDKVVETVEKATH